MRLFAMTQFRLPSAEVFEPLSLGDAARRGTAHIEDSLRPLEVLHVIVGGRERYARQPKVVKDIIRGLKDSLILQRFQSAGDLQRHLENLQW